MDFADHPDYQQCDRAVLLSSSYRRFIYQNVERRDPGKRRNPSRTLFHLAGSGSTRSVISIIIVSRHLARAGHAIDINDNEFLNVEYGEISPDLRLWLHQRKRLSLVWNPPENLDGTSLEPPSSEDLDHRLQQTFDWWLEWTDRYTFDGRWSEYVLRSSVVLKGLTNAPTGAIAAAATTSLPEAPESSRNWGYRFSWIRDSPFALRSLFEQELSAAIALCQGATGTKSTFTVSPKC